MVWALSLPLSETLALARSSSSTTEGKLSRQYKAGTGIVQGGKPARHLFHVLFVAVNPVGEDHGRIGAWARWPGHIGWHRKGLIAWVTNFVGCNLRRMENSAGRYDL